MIDANELAQRAAGLLEDPAMLTAFAKLKERYTLAWENSGPQDISAREQAHASLRALKDLQAQLRSLADAPKVKAFNTGKRENRAVRR